MNPNRANQLRALLVEAEEQFKNSGEILSDAITPALHFKNSSDRECVAFICSVLAYGKVSHIQKSIYKLIDPLGNQPVAELLSMEKSEIKQAVRDWKHRFNTSEDAFILLVLLKSIYQREGSLEDFFCGEAIQPTMKEQIEKFVDRIEVRLSELKFKPANSFWFFFPRPSSGSACKRLNLFLRWMVGSGPFDLNLWTKFLKKDLLIPLDVHLLNQARSLKLTKRKQADWKTVEEVTNKLKTLDNENPTRFDFALCHLGMKGKILASVTSIFLAGCQPAHKVPDVQSIDRSQAIVTAPVVKSPSKVFTRQDEVRFLRAVRDDDVKQVGFFISVGMDVNKVFHFSDRPETALMAAIETKSKNVIRLLLDSGARPGVLDDPNDSELIAAILLGMDMVALELLERGATPNKQLKDSGETALMSAARKGQCSVVKRLIELGADVNLSNHDDFTALKYAAQYKHKECYDLLQAPQSRL